MGLSLVRPLPFEEMAGAQRDLMVSGVARWGAEQLDAERFAAEEKERVAEVEEMIESGADS